MSTIKWYGPEVLRDTKVEAAKRLDKAAFLVERVAKKNAPVKTGRFRSSIISQRTGLVSQIGSSVNYALPLELGTSRMAARPTLRNALAVSLGSIKRIFA